MNGPMPRTTVVSPDRDASFDASTGRPYTGMKQGARATKDARLQNCSQSTAFRCSRKNCGSDPLSRRTECRACLRLRWSSVYTTLSPTSAEDVGIGRWCHAKLEACLE